MTFTWAIMAARFGAPAGRYGSETEKEFKAALKQWKQSGEPWILFYFHNAPQLSRKPQEIQEYAQVCGFREELESLGIVHGYAKVRGAKDGFCELVSDDLRRIVHRLTPQLSSASSSPPPADPTKYLLGLKEATGQIDIRGLPVGEGRANRFPIEELFISLTTTQQPDQADSGPRPRGRMPSSGSERPADENAAAKRRAPLTAPSDDAELARHTIPLLQTLVHDRLVVVGDPGAGKTTFLRRVANALCRRQLGEASALAQLPDLPDRPLPIFVRIADLAQHIERHAKRVSAPDGDDAPGWLPDYLGAVSQAAETGLTAGYFRQQLDAGRCTVLLDGLDEAPHRLRREALSRLIENLANTYRGCRLVVTSRPAAYQGKVVLPAFAHARIDPLADEAVETFLTRWCRAIYAESEQTAGEHSAELLSAVRARPELRRMARNPVMLTALAVVHGTNGACPNSGPTCTTRSSSGCPAPASNAPAAPRRTRP